jgi:hypothetical protein
MRPAPFGHNGCSSDRARLEQFHHRYVRVPLLLHHMAVVDFVEAGSAKAIGGNSSPKAAASATATMCEDARNRGRANLFEWGRTTIVVMTTSGMT